jgi:hypothetical protein
VSSTPCPSCGEPLAAEGTFCPWCGATVTPGTPPAAGSLSFRAPPNRAVGRYTPFLPSKTLTGVEEAAHRRVDLAALSSVTKAAILALVSPVLGILALVVVAAFPNSPPAFTTNPTGTTVNLASTPLYLIEALALAGFALAIGELLFCRLAFRTLAENDSRFSFPAKLALLALVGALLFGLAVVGDYVILNQLQACAGPGNPVPASCVNVGAALGGLVLLGVGGILALIGYLGLIVGLWRLGTRFKARSFKVGAILTLVPLLDVLGWLLIFLASRSSRRRIEVGRIRPEYD